MPRPLGVSDQPLNNIGGERDDRRYRAGSPHPHESVSDGLCACPSTALGAYRLESGDLRYVIRHPSPLAPPAARLRAVAATDPALCETQFAP